MYSITNWFAFDALFNEFLNRSLIFFFWKLSYLLYIHQLGCVNIFIILINFFRFPFLRSSFLHGECFAIIIIYLPCIEYELHKYGSRTFSIQVQKWKFCKIRTIICTRLPQGFHKIMRMKLILISCAFIKLISIDADRRRCYAQCSLAQAGR